MAQVQPRETGSVQKGLRFPVRLVILLLVVAGAVTLYVARTEKEEPFSVLVHVAGDEAKIVQTVGGTVESVLAEAGIQVGPHDVVTPSLSEYVGPDTEIEIVRAVPIRVTVDGGEREHWVVAATVAEALGEIGIELGPRDRVTPGKGTDVTPDMSVQVVRVTEEFIEETETLPFKVIRWAAPELEQGQTQVIREGQEGIIKKTVRVVYEDGKPVNRTIVASEV